MKAVAFSVACVVGLAAGGCVGKAYSADADNGNEEDITAARPPVTLASTEEGSSVQAKLYQLLKGFEGDPALGISGPTESTLLVLQGGAEARGLVRSLGCTEASRVDKTALAPILSHECTLTGFDAVRNGASLPPASVTTASASRPALANALFSLLAKAEQKGGFGVRRGGFKAPCCDQPSSTSYSIADERSSLSCTSTSGGFVSISSVSCLYLQEDALPPEVVKGTLVASVGIGGENTGFSAKTASGTLELVLEASDRSKFVAGRVARITGMATTLSGVETESRPAIDVTNLLVCPTSGASSSLKDDDAKWIAQNCPATGASAR